MGSPNISVPSVRATLAANVRACLEQLEWSESELARRSGVSQKQVNNIVRRRNGCSVEALHELGQALGLPFWLLLMPNLGRSRAEAEACYAGRPVAPDLVEIRDRQSTAIWQSAGDRVGDKW